MWFEALLGLKINLNKSEIIPIGPVAYVEELASELGCKVGSLPTSYLGLPLGAKHKALGVWDSVEERFRKRLASWKIQYISKGGRVTLIRSTLSSLPIYHLSLFRMPQKVCARLERIQRQFIWGGRGEQPCDAPNFGGHFFFFFFFIQEFNVLLLYIPKIHQTILF